MINEHKSDINISVKQRQSRLWNIDYSLVNYGRLWRNLLPGQLTFQFSSLQSYNLDIYEVNLYS